MKKINLKNAVSNLAFLAALAAMLFIAFRFDLRYVETGSMLPDIKIGAICLVDPDAYENAAPQVGDVAIYSTPTRDVIHRIVRVSDEGYIFKGDNNNSEDYSPVPAEAIGGKVVGVINIVAPLMRIIKHLG